MTQRQTLPMHAALMLGALALAGAASPAWAQQKGRLIYTDGSVLNGELLEQGPTGGRFRSARFGDVAFTSAEARFEADAEKKKPATGWRPDSWSVGLSGYAQRDNGNPESDLNLSLDASWKGEKREITLSLYSDYKVVDDSLDNNEQNGRLRWYRAYASPWLLMVHGYAQRHSISLAELPETDYLLLQGTLGVGVQKQWSDDTRTRVVLGRDRIRIDLRRYDVKFYTSATSVLLDNKVQITPKLSFTQNVIFYWWRRSGTGVDSDSELAYDVTDNLSIGLTYLHRRNSVSLSPGTYSQLSVTTRLNF